MKKISLFALGFSLITFLGMYVYADGNEKEKTSVPSMNTTILGKVIDDNTGETLTGAYVKIEGTEYTAYTDFEGNFKFENVPVGTYYISAGLISYDKKVDRVDAKKEKKIIVSLKMK